MDIHNENGTQRRQVLSFPKDEGSSPSAIMSLWCSTGHSCVQAPVLTTITHITCNHQSFIVFRRLHHLLVSQNFGSSNAQCIMSVFVCNVTDMPTVWVALVSPSLPSSDANLCAPVPTTARELPLVGQDGQGHPQGYRLWSVLVLPGRVLYLSSTGSSGFRDLGTRCSPCFCCKLLAAMKTCLCPHVAGSILLKHAS